MSKTSKIIETDLAPHIDIHDPAIIVGLTKLVRAAREDLIEEAAIIASKSYYEDDGGYEPMGPMTIAERIREELTVVAGLGPKGETTPEQDNEIDDLMNDLLG